MAATILTSGLTAARNLLKSSWVTHVGVSEDQTAFAVGQTAVNPGGGTVVIKSPTKSDVGTAAFDATITLDADVDATFVNKSIYTVSACNGSTAGDALTRRVRPSGLGIGFIAGDVFTIGVRVTVADGG